MALSNLVEFFTMNHDKLAEIVLGIIVVARMIAKMTPSKHDDEIAGVVERGARHAITLISGANHENLVKSQDKFVESTPKETGDADPFAAVLALVDKFDGKIVIVPKEKKDA